jgi:hypothetical protein
MRGPQFTSSEIILALIERWNETSSTGLAGHVIQMETEELYTDVGDYFSLGCDAVKLYYGYAESNIRLF